MSSESLPSATPPPERVFGKFDIRESRGDKEKGIHAPLAPTDKKTSGIGNAFLNLFGYGHLDVGLGGEGREHRVNVSSATKYIREHGTLLAAMNVISEAEKNKRVFSPRRISEILKHLHDVTVGSQADALQSWWKQQTGASSDLAQNFKKTLPAVYVKSQRAAIGAAAERAEHAGNSTKKREIRNLLEIATKLADDVQGGSYPDDETKKNVLSAAQKALEKAFELAGQLETSGSKLGKSLHTQLAKAFEHVYFAGQSCKPAFTLEGMSRKLQQQLPEAVRQSMGKKLKELFRSEATELNETDQKFRDRLGAFIDKFIAVCPFKVEKSDLVAAMFVDPVSEKMRMAYEACQKVPPEKNWAQLLIDAHAAYVELGRVGQDLQERVLNELSSKFRDTVESMFHGCTLDTEDVKITEAKPRRAKLTDKFCSEVVEESGKSLKRAELNKRYSPAEIDDWAQKTPSVAFAETYGRLTEIQIGGAPIDIERADGQDEWLVNSYHIWKTLVNFYTEKLCDASITGDDRTAKINQIEAMVTQMMERCLTENSFGGAGILGYWGTFSELGVSTALAPGGGYKEQYSFGLIDQCPVAKTVFWAHLKDAGPEASGNAKNAAKFTTTKFVPLGENEGPWKEQTVIEPVPLPASSL